jgi:hypothetical protein
MPWVPPASPVKDPLVTLDLEDLRKYLTGRETALTTLSATVTALSATVAAIPASAAGLGSMGFIASSFSNTVTVTHGLGTTPATVQVTADSASGAFAVCTYKNIGATTFQVVGWSPGVAITATIPFAWFVRA